MYYESMLSKEYIPIYLWCGVTSLNNTMAHVIICKYQYYYYNIKDGIQVF